MAGGKIGYIRSPFEVSSFYFPTNFLIFFRFYSIFLILFSEIFHFSENARGHENPTSDDIFRPSHNASSDEKQCRGGFIRIFYRCFLTNRMHCMLIRKFTALSRKIFPRKSKFSKTQISESVESSRKISIFTFVLLRKWKMWQFAPEDCGKIHRLHISPALSGNFKCFLFIIYS